MMRADEELLRPEPSESTNEDEDAEAETRDDGTADERQADERQKTAGWDDPDEADLDQDRDQDARPVAERRFTPTDSTFHGPASLGDGPVAGRDNNLYRDNNFYLQQVPSIARAFSGPFPPEQVARLRAVYSEDPGIGPLIERLRERLADRPVQVLQSSGELGQRAIAIVALDRLGLPIEALDARDDPDVLGAVDLEPRGYVIQYTERLSDGLLAGLRSAAAQAKARLVILVGADGSIQPGALDEDEYVFPYEPPRSKDIVWAHLRTDLTTQQAATLEARLQADSTLRDLYRQRLEDAGHRMTEAVSIAATLFRYASGAIGYEDLIVELRAELHAGRQDALRGWMLSATASARGDAKTPTLWDGALLIAAAVLNGFPLHRVTAAADRLADLLYGVEAPETPPPRRVFRNTFDACKDWLRVADQEARERRYSSTERLPGGPRTRRVWLPGERLPQIVLEIVWRDFDALHQPISTWLGDLAQAQSPLIRRRVAAAAGTLATYDFEHVERLMLRQWASAAKDKDKDWDRVRDMRDVAARALAVAAATDVATASVARRTARSWANPEVSGKERQETAFLAYEHGVGVSHPTDVQRILGLMETLPGIDSVRVLACLGRLVDQEQAEVVLEGLAGWDDLRRAEIFHTLTESEEPDRRQIALLTATAGSPPSRDALAQLLTAAFIEGSNADGAWRFLRRLTALAGQQPALFLPLSLLIRALSADAELHQRFYYHLDLWAHKRSPPMPAAPMLLRQLSQQPGGDQHPAGKEGAGDLARPAI
jgi:hypothetical protein